MTINFNYALSKKLNQLLYDTQFKVCFAETFTGGSIAQNLTAVTGSSEVFDYSYVCITPEAISHTFQLPKEFLIEHTVASEACAIAMAQAALKKGRSDIALSATGIAGPLRGTQQTPVGRVWIALANRLTTPQSLQLHLNGGRKNICRKTVQHALLMLIHHLQNMNTSKSTQEQLKQW